MSTMRISTTRAGAAALALGALATGGGLAAAAPAMAAGPAPIAAESPQAPVTPDGTRIWQRPAPDAGPADVHPQASSTDPSGRLVQQGRTPGISEVNGWMEVQTVQDGVRMRTQPGGAVVGTMPNGHPFYALCTRPAPDGTWAWSHDGNREGWVRSDMYGPYHRTGFPGSTDPMPGPCR